MNTCKTCGDPTDTPIEGRCTDCDMWYWTLEGCEIGAQLEAALDNDMGDDENESDESDESMGPMWIKDTKE